VLPIRTFAAASSCTSATSVVDYHNPEHIAQVRRVFQAANDHRMASVAHVRASVTAQLPWGSEEALIFLNEFLSAASCKSRTSPAPDRRRTKAPSRPSKSSSTRWRGTIRGHATCISTRPRWASAPAPDNAQRWATAIRRLPTRVLFGSDATTAATTPGGAWTAMRKLLPLTDDEFKDIANNTAPYLQ
jgi:hypothetical protein